MESRTRDLPNASRPLSRYLERAYGLDLRSLALFRIGLGVLIIGDLIWRARDLRAFYTDFGVLPRAVLLDRFADRWLISLHLLSGEALVQAVMFALAMGLGVMLLVGYRTKPATIASWALLISLQNRNPIILQGGDILLRMLAFWAMFLPLNAHFSFDRALDNSDAEPPQRVFTIGSVALLAQVALRTQANPAMNRMIEQIRKPRANRQSLEAFVRQGRRGEHGRWSP